MNKNVNDSTTLPNYLPRNKIYAAILIPLALILIFISGAKMLGILFAPPQLIADEIGPGLRIFQQLLGFIVAVGGIITAFGALTSSSNVGKFSGEGNQAAAEKASAKAQTSGKNTLLFIGFVSVFLILFVVSTFVL